MRRITTGSLVAAATIAALVVGAPYALANRDHQTYQSVQNSRISAESMKQKIDDLGYYVRRLEFKHGLYEARIIEKEMSGGVKALFDGATGELIRAELHD